MLAESKRLAELAEELAERVRKLQPPKEVTTEDIQVRAYQLWEQEDRLPNRDIEFWQRAERELRGE